MPNKIPTKEEFETMRQRLQGQKRVPTREEFESTRSRIQSEKLPKQAETSLLDKTSTALDTVFGGKKVGELIGGLAVKSGLTGLSEEERQFVDLPSAKEVAGSAGRSALLFTPVGRGAQAIGAGAKTLGVGGKLATGLGRISAGAGTGFSFDVASSLEREEKGTDIFKPGLGTVVGGSLPILGAIGRGTSANLSEKLPKRLVSSALKLSPKQASSKSGQKAVEQMLSGRVGTAKSIFNQSQKQVDTLSKQITQQLKDAPSARIGKTEVAKKLQTNPFFQDAGLQTDEVIEEVIRLVPRARTLLQKRNLTLVEANRLRQIIDQTLGDRFFNMSNPPFSKDLLNSFSRTLSDTIKGKAPQGTRELFAELSKEVSLRNAVQNALVKGQGNQILSFGDLLGGGIGTAFGGPLGTIPGIVGRRAIQSTPALTGGAQISKGIGETLQSIPQTGSIPPNLIIGGFSGNQINQSRQ